MMIISLHSHHVSNYYFYFFENGFQLLLCRKWMLVGSWVLFWLFPRKNESPNDDKNDFHLTPEEQLPDPADGDDEDDERSVGEDRPITHIVNNNGRDASSIDGNKSEPVSRSKAVFAVRDAIAVCTNVKKNIAFCMFTFHKHTHHIDAASLSHNVKYTFIDSYRLHARALTPFWKLVEFPIHRTISMDIWPSRKRHTLVRFRVKEKIVAVFSLSLLNVLNDQRYRWQITWIIKWNSLYGSVKTHSTEKIHLDVETL